MTLSDKLIYCVTRSKQNKYFVAPRTLIQEIEEGKKVYKLKNDIIIIEDNIFRIERG